MLGDTNVLVPIVIVIGLCLFTAAAAAAVTAIFQLVCIGVRELAHRRYRRRRADRSKRLSGGR